MRNITLDVDEDVIRRVRKVAVDRGTTMAQMVRDFLASVADRECGARLLALQQLDHTFEAYSRDMSALTRGREDLHERFSQGARSSS